MPKPHRIPLDPGLDAKVSQLRELLKTAQDLSEVSEYFHTVLVPDDAFMTSGTRTGNPRLIAALQAVLGTVAPEGELGAPLLIRLQAPALCHGYSTWGRGHIVFFYFEQLDLGFCSYSRSLREDEVTFLRFNLASVTGIAPWGARERGRA
jgi:hypothetical protein